MRWTSRPCPAWCRARHGQVRGEDDLVHTSGLLMVRGTTVRLCASVDGATGALQGPFVLVGDDEFTLHEAEALIDALTQLVDAAQPSVTPAGR